MRRGRKATPAALARLHGNPARRPISTNEPEGGGGPLWEPPAWFDAEQRAQWARAIEVAPVNLLSESDRELLAIWCAAAVEYARAILQVRRVGQVLKSKDGVPFQNPFLGIANRQALLMLRAGAEMGFSPASRAALGRSLGEIGNDPTSPTRPGRSSLAAYLAQKPDRLDS